MRGLRYGLSFGIGLGIWKLLSDHYQPIPGFLEVVAILFSAGILELIWLLLKTFWVVSACILISLLIGTISGSAIALSLISRSLLYPPSVAFKCIPITVLLPVFMTIFGLDYFIFPMLCAPVAAMFAVNIAGAIAEMPRERIFQRRLLRLQLLSYLRDVVFWETLGSLLSTLRIAVPFCLTLQVALDYFLSASKGIGWYIRTCQDAYDYPQMYAAVILVSFAGFGLLEIVDTFSGVLLKWKTKKSN